MSGFHAPDHDHEACADDVLARADTVCRKRGVRLTESRARVLDILARGHQPAGAYEIVEALSEDGAPRAAFLICRSCGNVAEVVAETLAPPVAQLCATHGFAAEGSVIEIEGLCRHCGATAVATA